MEPAGLHANDTSATEMVTTTVRIDNGADQPGMPEVSALVPRICSGERPTAGE